MAELGLAVLATPSALLAIAEIVRTIHRKISSLKSAPQSLERLRGSLYDLQSSHLKVGLNVLAPSIGEESLVVDRGRIHEDSNDKDVAVIRAAAAKHVERLQDALMKIEAELEKCVDEDGKVRRVHFVRRGERELERLGSDVRMWGLEFGVFAGMVEARRRVRPLERVLTWQKFQIVGGDCESVTCNRYARTIVPGSSHASIAAAEFRGRDGLREIQALIERPSLRDGPEDSSREISQEEKIRNADELCVVADYLCCHLMSPRAVAGILPCLGYRVKPRIELVFQVPDGLVRPRSLSREMITLKNSLSKVDELQQGTTDGQDQGSQGSSHDTPQVSKINWPEELRMYKIKLSQQLCQAVCSVYQANIVHKSIRPETIILFDIDQPQEAVVGTSAKTSKSTTQTTPEHHRLFLSHWNLLRSTNDPSSRFGDDDWTRDVYRHPERQGLQAERRYNFNHDVYSLGVCLLEIGLWEPLVIQKHPHGECQISDLYKRKAIDLGLIRCSNAENIHGMLVTPSRVRKVLHALVVDELSSVMGDVHCDVVKFCLDCLEKRNSTGELNSGGARPQALVIPEFEQRIVQPLDELS